MSLIDEYKKERRRLINLNYRLRKKGFNAVGLPPIPKRITKGSIQKLVKTMAKLQRDRDIAKKRQVKNSYKKTKQSTKAQSKKTNKKSKTSNAKTNTKKKSAKTKQSNVEKYIPSEKDRIIDNVSNSFYGIDDIDSLIGDMTIASKRGNIQHTSNINELKSILRKSFDNACFEDGETEVAKRLHEHSDDVNKAIETIEEYYKDSDEEWLREAIDEIENLIQIITDNNISIQEASELEEAYTRTTDFFNDNDEIVYKSLSDSTVMGHYQENNFIVDSETGEVLEKFVI